MAMDMTADLLNSLTEEQRKVAGSGDFGRTLRNWAASHVTYLWWVRTTTSEPPDYHNGTAFFLGLEDEVILVTAAHVLKGYLADRAKVSRALTCMVGNIVVDPEERLIDRNDDIDIATFRFSYAELRAVGKQPLMVDPAAWPPRHPASGQAAVLLGFPRSTRIFTSLSEVHFGLYVAFPRISSVSDLQITCPFDREAWGDLAGLPLPVEGMDMGGVSGGPLLLPMCQSDGSWILVLGGVIVEAPADGMSFETVIASAAHFIRADGRIDPGSAPMRFMQLEQRQP